MTETPPSSQKNGRRRAVYAAAVGATIVAGLLSRRFPEFLPATLGKYPGDVLWAVMVFFGWAALFPRRTTVTIAALAYITACAIEFLKLCPWDWLVRMRHTTLGHLVFGHVFSWPNLVAYAVGVLLGVAIERWVIRRQAL